MLMILGGTLFGVGLFLHLGGNKIPWGRLPGDFRIEGEHGGFYFPVVTCLVMSLLLGWVGSFVKRYFL